MVLLIQYYGKNKKIQVLYQVNPWDNYYYLCNSGIIIQFKWVLIICFYQRYPLLQT